MEKLRINAKANWFAMWSLASLLITALLSTATPSASGCISPCSCTGYKLRCQHQNLNPLAGNFFDSRSWLTFVDLDNTTLNKLPVGVFDNLTNLQLLSLSDNQIESFPNGSFDNLINLVELVFDNNPIKYLQDGLFDKTTKLRYLYFEKNDLQTLPLCLFSRLTSLTHLSFSKMALNPLPVGLVKSNLKLIRIYFDYGGQNQFTCSLAARGPGFGDKYLKEHITNIQKLGCREEELVEPKCSAEPGVRPTDSLSGRGIHNTSVKCADEITEAYFPLRSDGGLTFGSKSLINSSCPNRMPANIPCAGKLMSENHLGNYYIPVTNSPSSGSYGIHICFKFFWTESCSTNLEVNIIGTVAKSNIQNMDRLCRYSGSLLLTPPFQDCGNNLAAAYSSHVESSMSQNQYHIIYQNTENNRYLVICSRPTMIETTFVKCADKNTQVFFPLRSDGGFTFGPQSLVSSSCPNDMTPPSSCAGKLMSENHLGEYYFAVTNSKNSAPYGIHICVINVADVDHIVRQRAP